MQWDRWLIGCCCALYVSVMLVPSHFYGEFWHLARGEHAADWAQFFGGVASVVAAIFIASSDGRERRKTDAERRAATIAIIAEVARNSASALTRANADGPPNPSLPPGLGVFHEHAISLEEAKEALAALPLLQFPAGADLIGPVMELRTMTNEAWGIFVRDHRASASEIARLEQYANRSTEIWQQIIRMKTH